MPQAKFTDLFVKSLKPADKLQDFADIQTKGLHLRVTSGGVKSWQYIYRSKVTGKVCNDHIGRYPDVSYADARKKVLGGHEANAASKPVEVVSTVKKSEPTVDDAFELYRKRKLTGMRAAYEIGINLTAVIARHKWGALPITSLTKAMIRDALYHFIDKRDAPQAALKSQQRISTWLKWCCKQDMIPFNPIAGGVLDVQPGKPRERVLDENEIRKLWKACENPEAFGLRESYARALQLMLVTAARSGMVCSMTEKELNLTDRRGAYWDLPADRMKMGKPFVCPLNELAVAIIKRREEGSVYVCPTTSKFLKDRNRQPLEKRQLSFVVQGLCKTLSIAPFTPHDLRRTASALLCREYPYEQVSLLLAHEETKGVMKHYNPENRWNAYAAKREMADKLAAILQGIIGAPAAHLRRVA